MEKRILLKIIRCLKQAKTPAALLYCTAIFRIQLLPFNWQKSKITGLTLKYI